MLPSIIKQQLALSHQREYQMKNIKRGGLQGYCRNKAAQWNFEN